MKQRRYPILLTLFAILLALSPALAQGTAEDDQEDEKVGRFILEAGTWVAQPTGVELEPATKVDANDPFGTRPVGYDDHTQGDVYYKFGYELRRNLGKFLFTFYDQSQSDMSITRSTPGRFIWGETLAHPLFAGVNLDGLADGFSSDAKVSLSDFRIDYSRMAFENERVRGEWFVGWRRVGFDRELSATYNALVPGLPPLLPPLTSPIPGLAPQPDVVSSYSSFEGRGLEAGLEFEVPLWRDRLTLEAGFAVAGLRGDTEVEYASTTNYYVLAPTGVAPRLLGAPYPEFSQTTTDPVTGIVRPTALDIQQRTLKVGTFDDNRSTSASVIDAHLALRIQLWKALELLLGFRQTQYDNVGLELRPEVTTAAGGVRIVGDNLVGVNTRSYTEIERDATYEGFYFGLRFMF